MQKIGRNDPCWCGSGHKYKNCHMDFDVKLSEYRHKGSKVPKSCHDQKSGADRSNPRKRKDQCVCFGLCCRTYLCRHLNRADRSVGLRTDYSQRRNSGSLKLEGFPKSVCTSVNDQVCHGIPSADVILKRW